MLNELKEIKEKLNQLIQEVERLENAIHGEEVIIEKKDFKLIKKIGQNGNDHFFEYLEGIFFYLPDSGNLTYRVSMFKKLLEKELDRIILIKRKSPLTWNNGHKITHNIEDEIGTKLRENYKE